MADNDKGLFNLTEPVMMTFPALISPRKFKKGGKETGEAKYSATFSFKPTSADLANLKALALARAKERWPGRDVVAEAKANKFQFPFSSGDKEADKAKAAKKDREFYRGFTNMRGRSQFEPVLAGIENGNAVDYEGDARKAAGGKFYSGVSVFAQFKLVPYEGVGANPDGVTAYLNKVFSLNKGARVGGGQSAAEVFKGYVGQMSTEDPTAGDEFVASDDEIPV